MDNPQYVVSKRNCRYYKISESRPEGLTPVSIKCHRNDIADLILGHYATGRHSFMLVGKAKEEILPMLEQIKQKKQEEICRTENTSDVVEEIVVINKALFYLNIH